MIDGAGALRPGDQILAWTTTPWTLLSNAALAVSPDLAYVRTEDGHVIAEARAEAVLGEGAAVADRFHGRDMLGARYEPPFTFIATEEFGPKGHTVVPADFVSAEDGTGVVHTSISFGEDDFQIGLEQGIPVINPVKLDGTFDERMGPFAGRWVKDADPGIVEDLRARGRLLQVEERYLHSYPHCWRCGTPLLYYAKPSWYIRDVVAARPAAGRQRDDRLVPGAHQARPLRQVAGEQRRLGDLARALLGHAAAGVAQRGRRDRVHRLVRRARAAQRRADRGSAPAVRRRRSRSRRRLAASRCGGCPR